MPKPTSALLPPDERAPCSRPAFEGLVESRFGSHQVARAAPRCQAGAAREEGVRAGSQLRRSWAHRHDSQSFRGPGIRPAVAPPCVPVALDWAASDGTGSTRVGALGIEFLANEPQLLHG